MTKHRFKYAILRLVRKNFEVIRLRSSRNAAA